MASMRYTAIVEGILTEEGQAAHTPFRMRNSGRLVSKNRKMTRKFGKIESAVEYCEHERSFYASKNWFEGCPNIYVIDSDGSVVAEIK